MRLRTGVLAALAAGLTVLATAVPASAGTGASQACNDSVGYQEIPVNNGIVTIGAELFAPPTSSGNALIICFSNTVPGVPSTATGGALWVFFGTTGSPTAPTVYADLYCDDDLGAQTVDLRNPPFSHCDYANGVMVGFGTSTTVVPPGCLVFNPVGGSCLYYNPSPVTLPLPAVSVTVLNTPVL